MLTSALLPIACAGCGSAGSVWCPSCDRSIPPPPPAPPKLHPCVALGAYTGRLQGAVTALKFRGATALATVLGRRLADAVAAGGHGDVCCVAPVPTSPARRRRRGYDQASLLGAAVARRLGIPQVGLLWRSPGHPPQQSLPRAGRLAVVPHRFLLTAHPSGDTVLLVDDVVTTGATLAAARSLVRAHGADVVTAVVAVTPSGAGGDRIGSGADRSSALQENVPRGGQ